MKKLFIIIYVCVVAILKSYSQTNTISPASQEICSGASPSTLYGTISGSYNTIRWQQSLTGLNEGSDPRNTNPIDFTPAEGVNNSESYMPPALTQKTYYNRYIDFSGCTNCRAEWSTIVVVTVIPPLLDGHLPSGSTLICSNVPTSSYSTSIIDNATSYVWTISPASAGTISGTNTTANVTWNSSYSGIATIKVQGKNRCFSGNFSEELQVSVHPYPAVPDSPTGTMSLCQYSQNTSYSISSTGAASYNWLLSPSNAGTVSSLGTISTVTWNGSFSGQATIQVQSVGACNTSNYSSPLTIQVNPIPGQASNPEGLTSICQGSQPNNYSTSGANNATSYLWSVSPASAGTISGTGTTGTVAWSTTFTGLATISVKGVNSCGSGVVSNNLMVMVNPLPSKAGKPTGESAVCQGVSNSSFTTSGATNATSYIWNISPTYAGFITGTGISGGVSWNTSFFGVATINVTGVNSCGNGTVSENLNVTVNPLPSKAATPTGENTICQGTANSMFSTAGSSNATSYSWVILPASAANVLGSGTTGTVTWNNSFVGHANISVIGVNSCGSGAVSDNLQVTLSPLPLKAGMPTGQTTICQGTANSNFSTSGSTNGSSYAWGISPGYAGSISGSGTTGTVTWSTTFSGIASINVTGINSCGNGSVSDNMTITVNPLPSKPGTPTGQTSICQGTLSTNFSTVGSNNTTSYTWGISPASAGTISGNGTTGTVMWSSSYSGQVNINVTGVNSCGNGTVSDNLAVMVNPIPSKANTPTGANTLCQNSSGKSYSIVGSTYALSYQWNLMPEEAGMISGSSTTASVTWANGFTGTANIKVLGVNNCGTGLYSDVIAVTINPLPLKADMPSGPTSLCQNPSNQNYTVNQTTNATSYEWVLGPDACGIISGTGATSSLNMDNNFTGNATLKVRGINTCGAGAYCDPLTVIVNSFPDKPSTPSGRTNLCQGEPLTKYTSLSSNAVSYNWSIDPATSANLQPLKDSVFVSWKSNYAGTAYLSVSAVNGCGSITSDLKPITVNAKPIAPSKPGVVDYCKNQKVILVSSNVSCDNILWYDLSRNYLFTGNTNTIETLREGKAFKVVAKNAIGCISDSTTILANIQDVKADFTADYMSILKGSKVTFSDNSKNAATTSWVFGDGFTSTQKSPFHFFNNAGSFDIKLIVSSAINCQDTLVKKNYIVVSGATGISTETALGMKVYPIPARDVIYVDTKQYTKENDILLKLYSINGEELVTKKLLPGTINEVDIHTLCAGTYLINITVNGVISSTKILKSN